MENLIKMDDLGVPLFYFGNTHMPILSIYLFSIAAEYCFKTLLSTSIWSFWMNPKISQIWAVWVMISRTKPPFKDPFDEIIWSDKWLQLLNQFMLFYSFNKSLHVTPWLKKCPTGRTERTPKKAEYLITRSQFIKVRGPLGFGPINFWWNYSWNPLINERDWLLDWEPWGPYPKPLRATPPSNKN